MRRIVFGERIIASAGYDALRACLEVEFTQTGQITRFWNVPEDVWYGLRNADYADRYFQKNIRGRFGEQCMAGSR